ncbi:DLAT [Cordylochernes scorpioides]|uniref:DLAT n=1 Tax=Cordylochernes scorpioides TaxID=51811 RepID=A0ABY6L0J0_9ARAC|nr:DLAT [Cordylochernes scorpioides]
MIIMGLKSISEEIKSKVQEGKVHPQELQGATISVSDVGSLGVGSYSPVIVPPLACALAIGGLSQRMVPCSKEGHRAAQYLTVTLSCDHRVVDGAVGAQWLAHLRKLLENPQAMLL